MVDGSENIEIGVDIIVINMSVRILVLKYLVIGSQLVLVQLLQAFNHTPGSLDQLVIEVELEVRCTVDNLVVELGHEYLLDRVDSDLHWYFLEQLVTHEYLLDPVDGYLVDCLVLLAQVEHPEYLFADPVCP